MESVLIQSKGVEDSVNTLSHSFNVETSMISCFNNIKAPKVQGEIDIYDFLENVRSPEQLTKSQIIKARVHKANGQNDKYIKIKENLPCFTLNFSFQNIKRNTAIKTPTGFIYIDIDNQLDIDLSNNFVFSSWKSLSGLGRGILVKVKGLTLDNFKTTYIDIAKEINVKADNHASKATQYNIHSYDEDIYINNNSTTWECINEVNKNTPIKSILKSKRKDSPKMGVYTKLRFNNINDYDFKGYDFLYFENKKEEIAEVFIPKRIEKGNRNNIFSAIANQIKALNPNIHINDFSRLLISINSKHCKPPLRDDEVNLIIKRTFDNENCIIVLNKQKRFLFDPKKKLTFKEIMKIINPILGKRQSNKTIEEIQETLNNWDVFKNGKLTQKSLQEVTGKNIKTIEKYYYLFTDLRTKINNDLKLLAS